MKSRKDFFLKKVLLFFGFFTRLILVSGFSSLDSYSWIKERRLLDGERMGGGKTVMERAREEQAQKQRLYSKGI